MRSRHHAHRLSAESRSASTLIDVHSWPLAAVGDTVSGDGTADDRAASPQRHVTDFSQPEEYREIRAAVGELCSRFPGDFWRGLEPDVYTEEFVQALTEHGWLAALIPEDSGAPGSASPLRA